MRTPEPSYKAVRFNRGDRVRLDLSQFVEPPATGETAEVREAHAQMMRHHGRLGTVVKGDDSQNPLQRLYHRLTGRPPVVVRVAWDDNVGEDYLTPVTFRDQLRLVDPAG